MKKVDSCYADPIVYRWALLPSICLSDLPVNLKLHQSLQEMTLYKSHKVLCDTAGRWVGKKMKEERIEHQGACWGNVGFRLRQKWLQEDYI